MTNGQNEFGEWLGRVLENTMKSKAVLDFHESMILYRELLEKGWSKEAAWQFAFMGTVAYAATLPIKPLPGPKPDPDLMVATLYEIAKNAYSHLCKLSESFKTELTFLETLIKEQQGEVPK